MRPARLAAAIGLVLLQAAHSDAAAAGEAQIEYREDQVQRGKIPVAEPQAQGVDLRTLWYHLNAGRRQAARQELEQLRAAHPDWQPDADIRAALDPAAAPQRDPYGEQMQAIAGLGASALRALPAARLAEAADAARVRNDSANLQMLAWRHLERDEPGRALDLFRDAAAAGATHDSEGIRSALTRLARAAARSGNVGRVEQLARQAMNNDGPDLLLDSAWAERDAGRHGNAAALFRAALPEAAAAEGLALTLRDQGQRAAALDTACDAAGNSPRLPGCAPTGWTNHWRRPTPPAASATSSRSTSAAGNCPGNPQPPRGNWPPGPTMNSAIATGPPRRSANNSRGSRTMPAWQPC